MNYFELYPGDYLKATQRLTLLEHGAYLRLLMAYYGEEEALPADLGELYVTVSAISAADKAAVRKVADRFFPVASDGLRHNDRADAEIEKARVRMEAVPDKKANQAERQQRHRERRAAMFDALRSIGITPAFNVTTAQLEAMVTANVTRDRCDDSRDGDAGVTRHTTATRPHTPDPTSNNGTSRQAPEISQGQGTAAGLACRLMREAGCGQTNPSHPDLIAALAEGVTPEALADTVREALAANVRKPFAYAITTARGRRADGARTVITGQPRAGPAQTLGKTAQAINALEEMKNGLAQNRTADRVPETALLESGTHAGR